MTRTIYNCGDSAVCDCGDSIVCTRDDSSVTVEANNLELWWSSVDDLQLGRLWLVTRSSSALDVVTGSFVAVVTRSVVSVITQSFATGNWVVWYCSDSAGCDCMVIWSIVTNVNRPFVAVVIWSFAIVVIELFAAELTRSVITGDLTVLLFFHCGDSFVCDYWRIGTLWRLLLV